MFPSSPVTNRFVSQTFTFRCSWFLKIAVVLLFPSTLGLCSFVSLKYMLMSPSSKPWKGFAYFHMFLFRFFISISLHSTLLPLLSQIFPDAVKRNLPELLPMTHLCDHLLTVFHYMHGRCYLSLILEYLDYKLMFFGIVYIIFVSFEMTSLWYSLIAPLIHSL